MLETITEEPQRAWRRHTSDGTTALVEAGKCGFGTEAVVALLWSLPVALVMQSRIVRGIAEFLKDPRPPDPWGLGFDRTGQACMEQPVVFIAFPIFGGVPRKNNAFHDRRTKYSF